MPLMRRGLLAAAVLVAMAGGAQAQGCANPQTQSDMSRCAYADWQAADKELNAVWKQVKARVDALDLDMPGYAKALLKAQRVWITYRDSQCELEGWQAHGGTMEPMLVSGCMERLTRVRTQELRDIVSDR